MSGLDPNWLLSTIAQSSAALIAIVAGFVLSRLLSLSADKSGLENRQRDLRLQIQVKTEALSELALRQLKWDYSDFSDDAYHDLVESEGKLDLESAMNMHHVSRRVPVEFAPYWAVASETVRQAFSFFKARRNDLIRADKNLDEYLRNAGVQLEEEEFGLYKHVLDHLTLSHRQAVTGQVWADASMLRSIVRSTPANQQRRLQLQRDLETTTAELTALQRIETNLAEQIRLFGRPPSIRKGLMVLAAFAVTGLVVPVLFLPASAEAFDEWQKWLVTGLFLSGLGALGWYIYFLVRELES